MSTNHEQILSVTVAKIFTICLTVIEIDIDRYMYVAVLSTVLLTGRVEFQLLFTVLLTKARANSRCLFVPSAHVGR